jgi:hypothetical protein
MADSGSIGRYHVTPRVEYHLFQLFDPRQGMPAGDRVPGLDDLLLAVPGGVLFRSAGNYFTPTVDVEVCTTEPAVDSQSWDDVAEAEFESSAGQGRIASLMGQPAGPDLPLGGPGRYRLRACCRWPDETNETNERPDREPGSVNAEYWLIQIWPAH